MERVAGIEPATCPWQGYVLPLAPHPHIGALGVNRTPDLGLQNRCFTTRTNRAINY